LGGLVAISKSEIERESRLLNPHSVVMMAMSVADHKTAVYRAAPAGFDFLVKHF
jgi:hypothetical protein